MTAPALPLAPPAGRSSTPARPLARVRVRVRGVAALKVAEYLGLVLFTIVAPRWMGPERYGSFAAVLALVTVLVTACSLGGLVTFGRFVPEYAARGQMPRARALFVQLFWARAVLALPLALGSGLALPALLPGLGWSAAALAGGAVLLGATATTCFQVFYGLNVLGRSAVQDSLLRPAVLVLLVALGGLASLENAVGALFVAQVGFLALGLAWTRTWFRAPRAPFSRGFLLEHLRFGLQFFVAQLLLVALWRSGEVLVLAFSGQASEAAFFSVANAATVAFGFLMIQAAGLFIPTLSAAVAAGHEQALDLALPRLLRWLAIAACGAVYAVYALAPWAVRLAMGEAYARVADNLALLALGLPAAALLGTALTAAVVRKRARPAVLAHATGLLVFALLAGLLVPRYGSPGGAAASAAALWCAGLLAARGLRLGRALAEARFGLVLLLAAAPLSLFLLPAGAPDSLVPTRGILAPLLFGALLLGTRLIRPSDLRTVVARGLAG